MVRTQISVDREIYDQAKREAKRRGISFAELVRRSLAQTLPPRDEEQPWMRFAGALESGDSSASSNLDEVVYGRDRP